MGKGAHTLKIKYMERGTGYNPEKEGFLTKAARTARELFAAGFDIGGSASAAEKAHLEQVKREREAVGKKVLEAKAWESPEAGKAYNEDAEADEAWEEMKSKETEEQKRKAA